MAQVCGRRGAARCCDVRAAARQPDAGVELRRRRASQQRGRREQRAGVGMHVRHGGRLQLRGPWLQRARARGAQRRPLRRHDGRVGVRGVDVAVEQRG